MCVFGKVVCVFSVEKKEGSDADFREEDGGAEEV